MEVEWKEIKKEEFDRIKFQLAKSGKKMEGHTVMICDPPRWILWEDTDKKNFYDERWFLMIEMDWMGPDGELAKHHNREQYWTYHKNVRVGG